MTGLAFLKQYLLNVIESLSDKISFLDVRKLSSTLSKDTGIDSKNLGKSKEMFYGSVDNQYYSKNFGDTCSANKGCSSIVIKKNKMVVNSLDNMVNLYDMQDILNQPPARYTGHRSAKDFYGKIF